MADKIRVILYKSQPSRILGNRDCYIGLETAWETATMADPFFNCSQEQGATQSKLRLTMKFGDSSELHFTVHGERALALAYAPAFVQEIVDGLQINERIVWSCQGDNTIHMTQAGRYKKHRHAVPRWNEFTSFFFDLGDDESY